jgi:iron complex transport system substrate-binding protein
VLALVLTAALLAAGCGAATPTTTAQAGGAFPLTVTDDLGNQVTIAKQPTRIVSTAPSNTEILFALGLGSRVVGRSSLDDYPPEAQSIPTVGDYQVNTEAVIALNPDLVLGYLGNEEALASVTKMGIPTMIFNPADLAGIYANIETIGRATGADTQAAALVKSLKAQVQQIADAAAKTNESPKVFYALDNTLWTAGPGSFLDELLKLAHATNVADQPGPEVKDYYQFAAEQLAAADPDLILLPNTAYKSAAEFTSDARFANLRAVKEGHVVVIDDVIITRPGPRIAEGLKVLAGAIHPGLF